MREKLGLELTDEKTYYLEGMSITERGHEWASAVSLYFCNWSYENDAEYFASFGVQGALNH